MGFRNFIFNVAAVSALLLVFIRPSVSRKAVPKPIHVVVMAPRSDEYLFSYKNILPAVQIAVEHVEKVGLLPGYTLKLSHVDTECKNDGKSQSKLVEKYITNKLDVILGPVCDYVVASTLRITQSMNIPIISPGATSDAFSNKMDWPLLTRVGPVNFDYLADMFDAVMRYYNWNKIKLIYDREDEGNFMERFCYLQTEALFTKFRSMGIDASYVAANNIGRESESLLLDNVGNTNSSVIVLCAKPLAVREFMIKAHELNFDNGDYVFFNVDYFSRDKYPWSKHDTTREQEEKAIIAYKSLLTVRPRESTFYLYQEFSDEVKKRALGVESLYFVQRENEVNAYVGGFHDAVILYALGLNQTLEDNLDISDGSVVIDRMWNRTFNGVYGTVSVNENGDRVGDYSILDMDPISRDFRVVANYYGNRRQYTPVVGMSIDWGWERQTPPTDTPVCGFDGSKCGSSNGGNSSTITEEYQGFHQPIYTLQQHQCVEMGRLF